MSIGEKIADAVPEPVIAYFYGHPRALCVVTGVAVCLSIGLLLTADELDVRANMFRRVRLAEIQVAASEALEADMPVLATPAGKPVEVTPGDAEAANAKFRAVMDSDGDGEQAPPKRRKPEPPAEDEAPRTSRPRQPRAEKARTTDKPAAAVKTDYTADAQSFVGNVWAISAAIPITQPYALVVEANSDGLASALAEGARHNSTIRAFVNSGESSWILSLAGVGLTMATQTLQLMKDPVLREQAAATTREHLKEFMRTKGLKVPEPADVAAAA